jgi:hypothetical protein
MEKNTKILLGLGAVIAAYLILKPKKAIAQNGLVSLKKSPNDGSVIIDNNEDYISKRLYMPTVRESTPEEEKRYYDIMRQLRESKLMKSFDPNCVCAQAPCNCGDGGVKLDVLIPTQSSEY